MTATESKALVERLKEQGAITVGPNRVASITPKPIEPQPRELTLEDYTNMVRDFVPIGQAYRVLEKAFAAAEWHSHAAEAQRKANLYLEVAELFEHEAAAFRGAKSATTTK